MLGFQIELIHAQAVTIIFTIIILYAFGSKLAKIVVLILILVLVSSIAGVIPGI